MTQDRIISEMVQLEARLDAVLFSAAEFDAVGHHMEKISQWLYSKSANKLSESERNIVLPKAMSAAKKFKQSSFTIPSVGIAA